MNLKTCYYCGTKYTEEESRCPLCGQTEIEQDAPEVSAAAPAASKVKEREAEVERHPERPMKKKKSSKKSRGQGAASTVICIILALIVIAGVAFILNSLGIVNFGGEKTPNQPQQPDVNLDLPVDDQLQTGDLSCTAITVTPSSVNLPAQGIKTRLIVNLTPMECTEVVSFASSDESVVTVTQEGEITAVGPGQAAITVACGNIRSLVDVVCSFEVVPETPVVPDVPATPDTPAAPETPATPAEPETPAEPTIDYSQLSLSVEDFTLSKDLGLTWTILVKGVPEGEKITVEWSSDDVEIATVENGKVTAVATGKTKIRALIDGDKKELTAVVRCVVPTAEEQEPVDESLLNMSHTDVTLTKVGESFNIYLYKDDTRYAGTKWVSEDEAICVVNEDGRVTAVAAGRTNIVGEYEGKTYTCIIRCNLPEAVEPTA